MNPQDPAFKKLQKKWYDKLAETGFQDQETKDEELSTHSRPWIDRLDYDSHDFYRSIPVDRKRELYKTKAYAQEEYYRLARGFEHSHDFFDKYEQTIWHYWADGHSARKIRKLMQSIGLDYRFGEMSITRTIKKLEKIMLELPDEES